MTEWNNSPRYWKMFDKKKRKPLGSMKLSVMSYNVLAQLLLEDHPYLYSDCKTKNLDWSFRGPAMMKQFEHHKSDILCLQEVQEDNWKTFFQPKLKSLGYEGYFVKRTGSQPDGCAILFRHKKFKLIEFVPVNFRKGGVLDRDNVGVILLLKPRRKYYRGSVRKICVATTHLLFNPKRGDVKLAQLMLFLAEIEKYSYLNVMKSFDTKQAASTSSQSNASDSETRLSNNHPYCPVIFCGDMNLEPQSYLFDFIIKGHLRYEKCISQELSGQKEGMGGGYSRLSAHLLPENLGINDHCQYIKDASSRIPLCVPSSSETPKTKCDDTKSQNEGGEMSSSMSHDKNKKTNAMNTGHASHNFNFKSVYPHHSRLVTTHHGRASCMVDYIFYSCGETLSSLIDKESKSGKKKRKRCESTNSEKQHSSISLPTKTFRSECEHVASIHKEIETQELMDNTRTCKDESKLGEKDQSCQSSSLQIISEKISEADSPEPGEILSDNLECSTVDDGNQSLSDINSVVWISSDVGEQDITSDVDCNRNAPKCFPKDSENCEKYVSIQTLELIGYWSLLTSKQFRRFGCLPNNIFPSDHICLIAKFLLR